MICLKGKTAIVTGGSGGMGQAIVSTLSQYGANVVIFDVKVDAAAKIAEQIKSAGRQALALKVDITNRSEVQNCYKSIVNNFGSIDILVNNAGVLSNKSLLNITKADWDKVIAVNMEGPFITSQLVLPIMMEQKYGRIINISSVAGKKGPGHLADTLYAASKAGLIGLTKGFALEGARNRITVNAICPGPTETEMVKEFINEKREQIYASVPLGRFGTGQDIANAVAFLASDLAQFITGEIMDVNGGLLMD
ncbi:MAG: SDR family NAD(P)-dependent oxidoreductase [Peptococcales bacterium]|jgi:3-oxoacyl-[acyl-carrier protein] reductase